MNRSCKSVLLQSSVPAVTAVDWVVAEATVPAATRRTMIPMTPPFQRASSEVPRMRCTPLTEAIR
jgi:hypothetical protein